jgi:hypothetical protein
MVAVLSVSGAAYGQETSDGSETTPAPSEQKVSETLDALPGIYRVGVAGGTAPTFAAAAGLQYGYTEPQNDETSGHQRIGASIAAGVVTWSFASAAVRLDYRHDIHGEDTLGGDSGSVVDVTPILRGGGVISENVHLGGEIRARFTGALLASGIPTPDMEFSALAAYTGLSTWAFAFQGGYRLGQRGDVQDAAANLRPGDRVALGISQFDAVLLGLGLSKKISKTEILGEVTWDILVGSGAPSATDSPFRLAAGVRQHLSKRLLLQGNLEVVPLGRAPSLSESPLVPIEPRFTVQAGLILRFGKKDAPPPSTKEKAEVHESQPQPQPTPVVEVVPGSLEVTVTDATGHPISDAKVTLEVAASGERPSETVTVPLLRENIYILDEAHPGKGKLKIEAELLQSREEDVTIEAGNASKIAVQLKPQASVGSQLRGLVRAYSGQGVRASIKVSPGGHAATCNDKGEFEINLPPGKYEVIISADGYNEQRRKLSVGKEGVTVLNADLQHSAP